MTDPYAAVREFLADAEIRPEFAARAMARIEAQTPELGTSFLWCVRGRLIAEAIEEAEDLAAWCALASARLDHDADLAGDVDPTGSRARALLSIATQRAGEADGALDELRRLVNHDQRSAPDQDGVLFLPRTADTQS
jgi:hypothetical protein